MKWVRLVLTILLTGGCLYEIYGAFAYRAVYVLSKRAPNAWYSFEEYPWTATIFLAFVIMITCGAFWDLQRIWRQDTSSQTPP